MLGYICPEGRGMADRLLAAVAERLLAEGASLAGAVQVNVDRGAEERRQMKLHVLSGHDVIPISQNLGRGARGCHLDPDGLERMVALVERALEGRVDLLVINKFGKQEVDGRGFRPVIGQAIAAGVPVITAVNRSNLPAFLNFAGGIAEEVASDGEALHQWCSRHISAETARRA